MRGVDQDHARNLLGIPGGVHLRVQPAIGMTHQHVGAFSVSTLEQRMEFAGDLPGVPGFWPSLAPSHTSAVVGAHAGGLGELRGYGLVDRPYDGERDESADRPHEPAPDPRSKPSPWSYFL